MSQQLPGKNKNTALRRITAASYALFSVGIYCLFMGGSIAAFVSQTGGGAEVVLVLGIVSGLLCFFFGVMVKRRSIVALTVSTTLTVLYILYGVWTIIQSGAPSGMFVSAALLSQLYPAFSAMRALKKK